MGIKRKNGEGTAQLRKDGLPKTKNVLAKTKGECVDKLKTLKDTIAPANPAKVRADMPFGKCLNYWYAVSYTHLTLPTILLV